MERRFYALRLLYDGRRFRGFQRQPGLPTVQEALEAALLTAGVDASLAVAARTDAGVHALAQVVSFSARAALDPDALRRAVNAAAPDGLLALGAPPPDALLPYAWALPDRRGFPDVAEPRLDPEAMRAALALAVGEHDFAGFARPGDQRGTVRSITRAEVISAAWAPLHALVLEGRGFLRAMVRNLAGTAVTESGLGAAQTAAFVALAACLLYAGSVART